MSQEREADLVALDDALERLSALDARKTQVVELRFFGRLSVEESAEVMKVSEVTVRRDWQFAKAIPPSFSAIPIRRASLATSCHC